MNRRTYTLDYQPHPERDVHYINVSFPLLAATDHPCECQRESDPTCDTFDNESFEQFINRYALTPCLAFDEFIGDKVMQYANADSTWLYWFRECCSMGGSYRTLSMVTTWPVVRKKTETELSAESAALDRFMSNMKNEAHSFAQHR